MRADDGPVREWIAEWIAYWWSKRPRPPQPKKEGRFYDGVYSEDGPPEVARKPIYDWRGSPTKK